MNQDRRGKSMFAAVMGSTYPFGMVQALSKQQPSHVIIDEWHHIGMDFAGGSEPRVFGVDLFSVDYAEAEARLFDRSIKNPVALRKDYTSHGAITGRFKKTAIDYLSEERRQKMSLDKWLKFATAYGFIGKPPRKFGDEANRLEIEAREWEWLASQRETRPAPEVD